MEGRLRLQRICRWEPDNDAACSQLELAVQQPDKRHHGVKYRKRTRRGPPMCARCTLRSYGETIAEAFGRSRVPDLVPPFNIAPGQPVAIVRQQREEKDRELAYLRWGLIPSWADSPSVGERMANARSETAATK